MISRRATFLVCAIVSLSLQFAGGCQRPELPSGSKPQFSGSTLFDKDELSVSVTAASHTPRYESREYEPQIQEVRVLADGKAVETASTITSSWGKGGWSQSASFTAPPQAKAVTAVLKIKHIGKTFRMTVPFTPEAVFGSRTKWRVLTSQVSIEAIE